MNGYIEIFDQLKEQGTDCTYSQLTALYNFSFQEAPISQTVLIRSSYIAEAVGRPPAP